MSEEEEMDDLDIRMADGSHARITSRDGRTTLEKEEKTLKDLTQKRTLAKTDKERKEIKRQIDATAERIFLQFH